MPLRVTVELIPRGDESRKSKLAQIEIENDGTLGDKRGGGSEANYEVRASAELEGGYDEFAAFTMGPLKRGNYLDTVIDVMSVLHSSKMPQRGYITGRVEVSWPNAELSDGLGGHSLQRRVSTLGNDDKSK